VNVSAPPNMWLAVATLSRREIVRFLRQRSRIVGALATPIVFWFLLGSGLGRSFQAAAGSGGEDFLRYFFPGTLVMILLFSAVFSTISVIEDRRAGFLQGVLVAPVPRSAIVMGNLLGGTTLAVAQGLVLLPMALLLGLTPGFAWYLATFVLMVMVAFWLTCLGFFVAWRMTSTHGFHAIMNLFMIPMWMLSGAVFPASGAPGWLRVVMTVNPLSYGVSAIRRCLIPADVADAMLLPSWPACLIVTLLFAALMFLLCVRAVAREREVVRW
jgi:ABC-2 type transport system permease protein